MVGERDLDVPLRSMQPVLDDLVYVFAIVRRGVAIPADLAILGSFDEDEGRTIIVEEQIAKQLQLEVVFPCRRITLKVHSLRPSRQWG